MIPKEVAETLHEVPEDILVEAFEMTKALAWKKLLIRGKKFKHAGCTPIYLSNEDGSRWMVSSEETYQKPLH